MRKSGGTLPTRWPCLLSIDKKIASNRNKSIYSKRKKKSEPIFKQRDRPFSVLYDISLLIESFFSCGLKKCNLLDTYLIVQFGAILFKKVKFH